LKNKYLMTTYKGMDLRAVAFLFSILFLAGLSGPTASRAQGGGCGCTNCPQFMPDGFTGNFLINVQNASNPTLGQNGQGVCGVNLNFDHEYLGDLSITLTSPAGQSVTLIGPIGLFGPTDFTTWNVQFVPCGDPATPDPGFSATWNNNQPWGLNNTYTGIYYPNNGCLENFNSGPVNGTWTLTVVDGQGNDVGNFYDYEIIFCDPSGINCFSCAANAGALPQPDVNACQGAASLNLNLPPTWTPASTQPPAADYGYTYIISGPGGVILDITDNTDLTGFDPGTYTICGLSYLLADFGDIPTPNGTLTTAQLVAQLNGTTPPFCGKITSNCVNVVIKPVPDDVEETVEICAPDCYLFFNQTYCQSGTYVRNLQLNGCPYTATLYLTVRQPNTVVLNETICENSCSSNPAFPDACSAGSYTVGLTNQFGCDSTVTLNVTVLTVNAFVQNPAPITCTQTTVPLQGLGSTSGVGTTYLWTAQNGGVLNGPVTNVNATAAAPGDYQLRVCRALSGAFCCDSFEVSVIANQQLPDNPGAITGPSSLCQGQAAIFSIPAANNASSYTWTVPPGVTILSGQGSTSIAVNWNATANGNVCVTAVNACGVSAQQSCLPVALLAAPVTTAPQGPVTACTGGTETYSIPPIAGVSTYTWTITPPGVIQSGQGTDQVTVIWGNTTSATLCVKAANNCGTGPDACLNVMLTPVPDTPAVSGPAQVCPGSSSTYTLGAVNGATSYTWQVTGGTLVSGQGTASIQVNWNNTPGVHSVCASAANTCHTGASACFPVTITNLPAAGQIQPSCDGTNQNYTIGFQITGGTAPYTVNGGSVTNSTFLSNPIPSTLPYQFVITDALGCQSDTITGSFNCNCTTAAGQMNLQLLEACAGQTVTAQHQGGQNLDGNDISSFILHSNAGTSLGTVFAQNTTGTFGIQPGMAFENTYYISFVVGDNLGGVPNPNDPCLAVAQGQPVVFHEVPVANAGMDADTCGLELNLSGNAGPGAGQWSILQAPSGGALNFSNPLSASTGVQANAYGVYTLQWSLDNSGCTSTDTVSVTFNGSPSAGQIVHTCDAANENYTVTFPINDGVAPYTVNGAGIAGASYTSAAIANSLPYSFSISDANGCISAPVNGIFNCNCSTSAGQMDLQPVSVCEGSTVTATFQGGQNLDGNDTLAFYLHSSPGNVLGTVFARNYSGTFSFVPGMTFGVTYYISGVAGNLSNGFPDANDPCLSVAQGQPVVFYQNPVANAGQDDAVCGLNILLNGSGFGQWTLGSGPIGGSIQFDSPQSGATTAQATVAGVYTLIWSVSANGCNDDDQVNITFNGVPTLADLQRICDAANENYTVQITLSGGAEPYSINGSAFSGATYTSVPIPNGGSYNFAVSDLNGCTMPDITGAFSCNCATSAGTMQPAVMNVCEGNTVSVQGNNDIVLDANDVISFVLHNGSGAALGQVFAQNTTGTFGFQNGMVYGDTYYISLVAGNSQNGLPNPQDPCFSVAVGQPVVFLKNPQPNAGLDQAICGNQLSLAAVNSGFSGAWTQLSGPGISQLLDPTAANTSVTANAPGVYVFRWTEANGICEGQDEVQVTFNEIPVTGALAEDCNSTNTSYTVSFSISGGQSPYTVSGLTGTVAANSFLSSAIPNNTPYSATVTDANGCSSLPLNGSNNCDCITNAGSMSPTPLVLCADQSAVAIHNNDEQLDGDDILLFVLHTQSGSQPGTILASGTSPVFGLTANMLTGVTYYISALAGSAVNGNVNLSDPCLDLAPGTPVRWKPLPTATLTGDATICNGGNATLTFKGSGEFPLEVTYTDGTQQNTLIINNNQVYPLVVTPTISTQYSLVAVTDGSLPTCTVELTQAVNIQVNQPLSAGISNGALELCAGVDLPVQLGNLLTGADFGGNWQEISAIPSTGNAFNAATGTFQTGAQAAGTYRFIYRVVPAAPCPADLEEVQVVLTPLPLADAGENKTLNCNQVAVVLGNLSTTQGAGVTYVWTLDGQQVSDSLQHFTGTPGAYTLVVTSPQGCTSSDEVLIDEDNEVPTAQFKVTDASCFGEKDGRISVASLTSTHLPVLYSVNGGPFSTKDQFSNLSPGVYSVRLQDANGCEWEEDSLVVEEPAQIKIQLEPSVKVNLGDSATLAATLTVPLSAIAQLKWTPLRDTVNKSSLVQSYLPLFSEQITLMVQDTNGCKAEARAWVYLDKIRNVFVPNIIYPGSANNGIAGVSAGKEVTGIESFQIYSRWGEKIYELQNFQPNQPGEGWDGRFKGETVQPGVYIYYAVVKFIDGEKILFKGDITVFR
jgi:hypothetical protein